LLATRDPETAARLMPTDPQRIVRALEVLESTGRSLREWQQTPGQPMLSEPETERFVILPEREQIGPAIDARFDAMLRSGALDEVRALMELGYSSELPVMRALGVASLASHLTGSCSLEEAITDAKSQTRKYAKRQQTWLKRNMITWKHIDRKQTERIIASYLAFIDI
jgi:tRNA dimethylallyltransferase